MSRISRLTNALYKNVVSSISNIHLIFMLSQIVCKHSTCFITVLCSSCWLEI